MTKKAHQTKEDFSIFCRIYLDCYSYIICAFFSKMTFSLPLYISPSTEEPRILLIYIKVLSSSAYFLGEFPHQSSSCQVTQFVRQMKTRQI